MADRRLPTRELLISGAFAAIQTVLFAAVVPVTTALAASAPPAYALVAGVHTLMPFLARLVTGLPGTGTSRRRSRGCSRPLSRRSVPLRPCR
jgi:hypothetical protein